MRDADVDRVAEDFTLAYLVEAQHPHGELCTQLLRAYFARALRRGYVEGLHASDGDHDGPVL